MPKTTCRKELAAAHEGMHTFFTFSRGASQSEQMSTCLGDRNKSAKTATCSLPAFSWAVLPSGGVSLA